MSQVPSMGLVSNVFPILTLYSPVKDVVIRRNKISAKTKFYEDGIVRGTWPSFWREIFEQSLCCLTIGSHVMYLILHG